MERRELDNIYLDEEGYKEYIKKTKQLKEEFDKITSLISKIVLDGRKEDATSEYESLMFTRKSLKETIETREREEQKIIIVSRTANNEFLDIGDVVKVKMVFPNGEEVEDTFELVACENDLSGDISKISVNVPLGKCVYRKNVGDVDSYGIRDGKVIVTVLEKIPVKKLNRVNKDL